MNSKGLTSMVYGVWCIYLVTSYIIPHTSYSHNLEYIS